MISFRQHLVSIVSVFLALAVGVVLGGGPLSEVGRSHDVSAATADGAQARESSFARAYVESSAPTLLDARLAGNGVALVVLPGVDEEVVEALRTRIGQARSRVLATYDVEPALLEPTEKALVDTLGSQLMTQYAEGAVAADAPTYVRLGELMALAVTSPESPGTSTDARARSLLDSLAGAELLTAREEPSRRPALVLVVHGGEPAGGEEQAAAADAILTGLLAGLRGGAAGVVLATDLSSGVDGQLARIRDDGALTDVATVDGVDTVMGQVAAVLALARALRGEVGDFGASGADGALPLG